MARPRIAVAGIVLILEALLSAGCAKMGDPQPPIVLVPKPAADLAVRQYSHKLILTLSVPSENTNGSPVTVLPTVEVFRLIDEKSENVSPLAEEEFLSRAQPLLNVPAKDLSKYLHDKTLVFEDSLALADRTILNRKAVHYAVRFVNKKHQTAGLSKQAFLVPVPMPDPPAGLSAELSQENIRLQWVAPARNMDGSVPPRIVGYNIYRTEDLERFPPTPLNKEPLSTPEFEDRNFEFDKTYYFAVSVVGNVADPYAESLPSALLTVQTKDDFPPGAPQQVKGMVEKGVVILLWTAPTENDVAGYRVYRREEGRAGKGDLLQKELIKILSYRDEKVASARKYIYSVTTVDTHGNEGPAISEMVEVP